MASSDLVKLVLDGDVSSVTELLDDTTDLNADHMEYTDNGVTKTLSTPLIVAAIETGNKDMVKVLLEKGADVNKYYHGIEPPAPIYFMTEYSHPKVSEELALVILQHADLTLKNSKGQTILFEGQLRSPEYATKLIQNFSINIAERDCNGHTVVDEVLFHDMYHLMPVYQQYVMSLIQNNDVTTIRNLVLNGFEYILQGGGMSALEVAESNEATEVLEFIKQVPQIMDTVPTLHSAIGAGNLEGVKAIINEQLAVAKDSGGRCALHLAVMCENEDIAKYLIENHPATIQVTDVFRRTPLHYAAALMTGADIYDLLAETGPSETAADCFALTPPDYRSEMLSPGSKTNACDIPNMIENERKAKYGVKIYLKLQYQALLKAFEENNLQGAKGVIDNLAFPVEDFVTQGVSNIPLLFLSLHKNAEEIALYLLSKGADPSVKYEGVSLADAAFKAKMEDLYKVLANTQGFKPRRMSAFSETSSMLSDKVVMPDRPGPSVKTVPAGLSGFDSQYLGRVLGQTLVKAISEVAEKRPWDPIEYLAQLLYNMADNEADKEKQKEEAHQVELERYEAELQAKRVRRMKKETKHLGRLQEMKAEKLEEERRLQEEEERRQQELEELRNKQREMDQLAQPPELDTVKEDDEPAATAAQQETEADDNTTTPQDSDTGQQPAEVTEDA